MATLAKDTPRQFELGGGDPDYNEIPMIADDIIYAGAAVGEDSSTGLARPLVAGDTFLGFAVEKCDNAGGAAGAKLVNVRKTGSVWLTVTSGDNINDLGDTVYASDDNVFLMASTGNTAIGKISRYNVPVAGKCLVDFEAAYARSI